MFRIFNLIFLLAAFGSGVCGVCAHSQDAPKPAIAPPSPTPPDTKPVAHWDTKNALVVPFEYNLAKNTSPAVWLRINGSEPHLFIVDTGSGTPFMLTAKAAGEMKLDPDAKDHEVDGVKFSMVYSTQVALRLPATQTNAAKDIPLPAVSFADIPELNNPVFITDAIKELAASADGDYSAPVAGLLGIGFLRQAYSAVQFDFVRHEMTLYSKITSRLRIPGAATVPIRLVNGC